MEYNNSFFSYTCEHDDKDIGQESYENVRRGMRWTQEFNYSSLLGWCDTSISVGSCAK